MYVVLSNGQIIVNSEFNSIEIYADQSDAEDTVVALKKSLPFLTFEAVKVTNVNYCGECWEDFKPATLVHYAFIENNCFCSKCKSKLNIAEWDKRFFVGTTDGTITK